MQSSTNKADLPSPNLSVTVIIPAYEAAKTIGRALSSVATQSVLPNEIIVIDDGSKDGTGKEAARVGRAIRGINFKLLTQNQGGAGAARNRGINEAKCAIIAFLDADDEWLPKKLELSLKKLHETNSILVSHNYILCDGHGRETTVTKCEKNFLSNQDPYISLYKKGYIATSAVLANRNAIINAGGFNEKLPTGQDFSLWLSLLKKPGTRFHIFGEALVKYHVTAGSITSFTNRRLHCTLKIAKTFLPHLYGRQGLPILSFWYRILSVHYEAVTAHFRANRPMDAINICLKLPVNLILLTVSSKFN